MMSKIVSCFLCGVGGYQTGSPEFEDHLMHDHGVVFDDGLDFMTKLSEFKTLNLKVPDITKRSQTVKPSQSVLCQKCETPPVVPSPVPVPAPTPATAPTVRAGGAGLMLLDEEGLPSLYGWTCTCALCHYTTPL